MKKVIMIIIIGMLFIYSPSVKAEDNLPEVTNHQRVKIYLFWNSWCGYCQKFINYFNENYDKYTDYFQVVTYQLDSYISLESKINKNLRLAVCEELKAGNNSTPLIVIGDWYQLGFGSDGSNIVEKALKEYQNNDYTDVVRRISNEVYGHGISRSVTEAKAIVENKLKEYEEESTANINYIVGPVDIAYKFVMNVFIKIFG